MQVIWKSKNKEGTIKGTDPMDAVLHVGRVSRYMERKYIGRTKGRETRIREYRGIFSGNQERVWRRGGRIGKSGRTEEAGTRRENDRRVCSRIQEDSKEKLSSLQMIDLVFLYFIFHFLFLFILFS